MYLLKGNVDEISRELVNNPFYIFFSQMYLKQRVEFCGSRMPHEFVSIGDTAKITFVSDGSITRSGTVQQSFNARYCTSVSKTNKVHKLLVPTRYKKYKTIGQCTLYNN